VPFASTAKYSAAWPSSARLRYLDFDAASAAIEAARHEAAELGLPANVVPPLRLEDCNRHTIEACLASPRAGFGGLEVYADLASKAAVLTYTLAKSQACIDGNKRIAFLLLNEFLAINGAILEINPVAAVAMILDAANSDRQFRDQAILELATTLEHAIVPHDNDDAPAGSDQEA
jgi:prophage maintenance system killer protein